MKEQGSLGTESERRERLREVLQSEPSKKACRTCLSQLDDYIAAQMAGEAYLERFADVAVHLDACLDCASAYARLYELEVVEANNRLPQPAQLPEPDLSFLQTSQAQAKQTDLAVRLREAIYCTIEKVRLQLSADLLPLLRPLPTTPLTRTPVDSARYSEVLLHLEPAHAPDLDLPIALTAYRDAHQPETCLVEVVVEPPGQSWPNLGGKSVTVTVAGEKYTALTDVWGVASFANVRIDDLAQMTLEVTLVK